MPTDLINKMFIFLLGVPSVEVKCFDDRHMTPSGLHKHTPHPPAHKSGFRGQIGVSRLTESLHSSQGEIHSCVKLLINHCFPLTAAV